MTDGRDVTETGELRPWWRTSADDGDDPIARLLEEPGPGPAHEAGGERTPAGKPPDDGPGEPARQPLSLVAMALVAGFLAMVLVLVAVLSAGDDRDEDVPSLPPAGSDHGWGQVPVTTCRPGQATCAAGSPAAGSVGAEGAPASGARPRR